MTVSSVQYLRRAAALELAGVPARVFRKWLDAGLVKAYYLKDVTTGLPEGRAFYRSDEVEACKVGAFVEGNNKPRENHEAENGWNGPRLGAQCGNGER